MQLSKLVRYRNNLEKITPSDLMPLIFSKIDPVIDQMKVTDFQVPQLLQKLNDDRTMIQSSVNGFHETLVLMKSEIDKTIEEMGHIYFSNSYKLYQEMRTDTNEYILNRRLSISQKIQDFILTRVQMNSNWKHPGAVIRPGLEPWMQHLVACDPLYLIDTDHGLFDPIKSQVTESLYQRLRFYVIQESDQHQLLEFLPDNQFGYFLVYNFFHYKPLDLFKNYLAEIYHKLSAGGCLAFTFNDCDRSGAVELAERWYMCYTPGKLIKSLCENLGFEIISSIELDGATTWMEVKKPGSREPIKGGQTLAKIIVKSK